MSINAEKEALREQIRLEREDFALYKKEHQKRLRALQSKVQKLERRDGKARLIAEVQKALQRGERWNWLQNSTYHRFVPLHTCWNFSAATGDGTVQVEFPSWCQNKDRGLAMHLYIGSWSATRIKDRVIYLEGLSQDSPIEDIKEAANNAIMKELNQLFRGK